MDEQLILNELRRLEAERKLRAIPDEVLETAWVREAQVEAVIDAVLAIAFAGDPLSYAHARHVGEWCSRIATHLPYGPDPSFARRVGVLADADTQAFAAIPELESFATYVHAYQCTNLEKAEATTLSLIVIVADAFERCIAQYTCGHGPSPQGFLIAMRQDSDTEMAAVVEALERAARPAYLNVA